MLYSSIYWKASTNLAATVLIFSFAARSCSSFSRVSCLSALKLSYRTLAFSLQVLASSMAAIRSFPSFEFSTSKATTRDPTDMAFTSLLRYFEVIWMVAPNT